MMSVPGRASFLREVPLGIWKYGRDSRARKIIQNIYVCTHKFIHHTNWNYLCVFPTDNELDFPFMANVGRSCTCMLSCVRLFVTLWTVAATLLCPRNFSGKNTGVGCHFLLQGSSRPRNWTRISCVSCVVGSFVTTEPLGKPLLRCVLLFSC